MSISGKPLPSSRIVSLLLYPDAPIEDPKWTLNAMQYGQIITHDMSMIAGSTQARKYREIVDGFS
jgi:peroxidase